jgi:peptidoglycan/xylan/chitin deacetylase (PgdA/CDA1 family)
MTDVLLRVLTYHKINEPSRERNGDPSLISATPEAFDAQMRHVAARYRAVTAEQVADAMSGGRALPPRAVLITFDDATRDFGEVAWPILRKHHLPATVFVPSAFPGRAEVAFWWDRLYRSINETTRQSVDLGAHGVVVIPPKGRRQSLVRNLQRLVKRLSHEHAMEVVERVCVRLGGGVAGGDTLSWAELRTLAADGVSVGAHTHSHPALTRMSELEAAGEIERSRTEIARALGSVPRSFAYPFGDHNGTVANMVRQQGFDFAVTCLDGRNDPDVDPMRLRRINITRRTTQPLFAFRLTPAGILIDQWRHRQVAA